MNILFINSCPRGKNSRTLYLAKKYIDFKFSHDEIDTLNIYDEDIKALNPQSLEKRNKLIEQGFFDDAMFAYAKQIIKADKIIIAAPYWDLFFPAKLKDYLEQICVTGVTFTYSQQGTPISFCKADELIYITTSGGYIGQNNFGYDYLKAFAETFLGIEKFSFILAQGLDIVGNDANKIISNAISQFE